MKYLDYTDKPRKLFVKCEDGQVRIWQHLNLLEHDCTRYTVESNFNLCMIAIQEIDENDRMHTLCGFMLMPFAVVRIDAHRESVVTFDHVPKDVLQTMCRASGNAWATVMRK